MDGMNKEKWKAFSTKEKWDYFWYYYKIHAIVGLLVLLFGSYMIYEQVTNREPLLSVVMLNVSAMDASEAGADFDEFLNGYGYEIYDDAVNNHTGLTIYKQEENEELYSKYYFTHADALFGLLYAGAEDVMLGRGEFFTEDLVTGQAFADLREILPQDTLEKYADQLLYCTPYTEGDDPDELIPGEPYPCAIYLENNSWVLESGYYESCYVAIPKRPQIKQITIDFMEYLLQQ